MSDVSEQLICVYFNQLQLTGTVENVLDDKNKGVRGVLFHLSEAEKLKFSSGPFFQSRSLQPCRASTLPKCCTELQLSLCRVLATAEQRRAPTGHWSLSLGRSNSTSAGRVRVVS